MKIIDGFKAILIFGLLSLLMSILLLMIIGITEMSILILIWIGKIFLLNVSIVLFFLLISKLTKDKEK